jgi:3-dehydroquinate synthase
VTASAGDGAQSFRVRSRARGYEVVFDDAGAWVERVAREAQAFTVVDENVLRLYGEGPLRPMTAAGVVPLPVSEERKTFDSVAGLADLATRFAAKRNVLLVSVGGGITQDLTGFLASTLYRGVRWIYVPTTLLAMADSCIGGKTSLNLEGHKNLLGTIYPPERVIVQTSFVETLSEDDYLSGLGEVVKLHLLGGARATARLREELPALLGRKAGAVRGAVAGSLAIKRDYIEDDEFDRGRRNLLNFGHCFGHALETTTGFAIPHGQAVTIGMLLADAVAVERGLLDAAEADERRRALYLPVLGLRPSLDAGQTAALVTAMKYDKKRVGEGLALVMAGPGGDAVRVDDLGEDEALRALGRLPGLLQR